MSSQIITHPISLPAILEPICKPARYKALYGGRGGSKSWGFATLALLYAAARPGLRILCVREVQKTLAQSAKRLIEDRIAAANLGEAQGFVTRREEIILPGGGLVSFVGMQDYNADNVKSLEGYHVAWCEEAQTISERSLELLRPTIREPGSELWFGWNPRRRVDPVDLLFRGGNPPSDSIVIRVGWQDNPWFPPELDQERRDDAKNNPLAYPHIWEGEYQAVTKGAYYAPALAQAYRDGRIGFKAADPLLTYHVSVDIGGVGARADAFTMWVAQWIGDEIRFLNAYEAQGQEAGEHIAWLLRSGYKPGRTTIHLPHDGRAQKGPTRGSWETTFRDAGFGVSIVENQGAGAASARIEAARRLFPKMTFNASTTESGRDAIGAYHEKIHEQLGIGLGPEHDFSSHSADAFGLMAIAYRAPKAHQSRKFATPTV